MLLGTSKTWDDHGSNRREAESLPIGGEPIIHEGRKNWQRIWDAVVGKQKHKSIDVPIITPERMTKNFQKELRNSEIWDQMVAEYGEKRAEEILKECKAEVKHGI